MSLNKIILSVLAWIFLMAAAVWVFLPNSWWMSVDKVFINDSYGDKSPEIAMNLTFNQDILLKWYGTIFKRNGSDWDPICGTFGEGDRYPNYSPSNTITIESFFEHSSCSKLVTGEYYIEVDWEWDSLVRRSEITESNVFIVYDDNNNPTAPPVAEKAPMPPATPPKVIVKEKTVIEKVPVPIATPHNRMTRVEREAHRRRMNVPPFLRWLPFFH